MTWATTMCDRSAGNPVTGGDSGLRGAHADSICAPKGSATFFYSLFIPPDLGEFTCAD